jgi:tRNA A-37 threonylcarbamoyl transferase component Bud32
MPRDLIESRVGELIVSQLDAGLEFVSDTIVKFAVDLTALRDSEVYEEVVLENKQKVQDFLRMYAEMLEVMEFNSAGDVFSE